MTVFRDLTPTQPAQQLSGSFGGDYLFPCCSQVRRSIMICRTVLSVSVAVLLLSPIGRAGDAKKDEAQLKGT
jgi:hypothetical protein